MREPFRFLSAFRLRRPFPSAGALGLLFGLISSPSAYSADPKPSREPAPIVENVTVDITSIDVVVTDSAGKRVKGLTREDFELFQDGSPQKITNFFAVDGGSLIPEPVVGEAARVGAEEKPVTPPPPRTWIVIYVDNQFLSPLNRTRAVRGVVEFLRKNLSANSEAMIVTADRDFKIRRRFTDRMGDLVEVLDKIQEESSFGAPRQEERNKAFQEIEDAKSADRALNLVKNYAKNVRSDVDFSLGALKELMRTLSGLDGRKILVHVSDGLPASAGRELFDAIEKKFHTSLGVMTEFDRGLSFESVVNQANAVGVTIYALDASGLSLEGVGSAEVGRSSGLASALSLTRWNTQDTLKILAEGTGGIALVNRNEFAESLKEVEKDLGNYYSLGFPAPSGGSERIRRVEVKTRKPSLTVRARRGYSDKSVAQRIAEQVNSALFFPRSENPLEIGVVRGKTIESQRGTFLVPIEIRIPIRHVTLVPMGDKEVGRVHLYFAVLDSTGRQSDLSTAMQEIEVPSKDRETARKKNFIYETKLLMLPGSQRLSLAVRDEISGQVSFVTNDLFISVFGNDPEKSKTP